jgi:Cof subfamily protein (haloacid dehalogenase superfamily)
MIAMDIDGTLLDSHWCVPQANQDAILEAKNRGMEIVLVTGRRFDFARPVTEQLPCEVMLIVNNGALLKSPDGRTHLCHLLPRGVARFVLNATREHRAGTAVVFDRPKERQVIFERLDWSDPTRQAYYERNREFLAQVAPLEDCLDDDPIQVMFTGGVEPMRRATALLRGLAGDHRFGVAVTEYEQKDFTIIDVIRHGCTKGATLAALAALRGIQPSEVMAIGDNWNDREMLDFAGLPVVMANAVPELKMPHWKITLSNDEGGVAEAIRAFAFEKSCEKI